MREAGLSCEYFVRQTFDQKDNSRQYRQLELFNEILEEVQYQRWLLVIDESHEFRNRYNKNLFNYDLLEIQKRWNNLMSRHQESRKVIDLPVLTAADIQEIDLSEMASQVTIESGEIDLNAMADLDIYPYYQHTAKLQTNRDYAETLPDDLISSKLHSDKKPLLYMLLLHQDKYRGIFYDPVTQKVTEPNTVALLNKIACDEDTPVAHVDFEQVENLSDICLDRWCKQHQVVPDEVERICSLYLKPENQKDDLKELLFDQQSKS